MKTVKRPTLHISMKAQIKIQSALLLMKSNEVSWFGIVKKVSNLEYKLIDIMFPPQICRPAYTETNDEKFPAWFYKVFLKNNNSKNVRLHGHTHPNFGVTPSGVDVNQFQKIMENDTDDYFIQFIINNSFQVHCALHEHVVKRKKNVIRKQMMDVKWTFKDKLEKILDDVVELPKVTYIPTYRPTYSYLQGYQNTLFNDDDIDDYLDTNEIGGLLSSEFE